ncbi:MAG: hypothetical protein JO250_01215 [Armatimonadetes bacterium]|nr:hypothetical protein [Armatimonadota bacterium]
MKLVAILRKSGGLSALVSRRRPGADLDALLAAEEAPEDAPGFYDLAELPLSDVPAALYPRKASLLAAWDALRAVKSPDTALVQYVLTVLRETILGTDDGADLPPFALPDAPAPMAPTAAHPRAYRGTKYRPPREKSAPAVDLRPYLCATNSLTMLLKWLAESRLGAACDAEAEWQLRLPPLFRACLLPPLRPLGRAETNACLALYWRLELETQPSLLAAVTRLLCLQADATSRCWLELVAALPAEHRILFADLLLETETYCLGIDSLSDDRRRLFVTTVQGPRPASRLYGLLRALQHGVSLDYVAVGFRLDDAQERHARFHEMDWAEIVRDAYYPEAAVAATEPHWADAKDYHRALPWHVWWECGKLVGLGRVIEAIDWMQYPPETSYQYSRFYRGFADYDSTPEDAAEVWTIIGQNVPRFEALLQATPFEYQGKLIANLKGFCWNWEDPKTLRRCLPAMDALLRRLCRPPFRRGCDLRSVGTDFLEFLTPEQREQFLAASDACFQRLEEACRRDNDARLVGSGTWSLTRYLPEWTLEAFLTHPAKLFKVCKLLGSFSHALRDQLVREFAPQDVQIPMPRLLREYEAGTRRLPDAQRAHYQAQWRQQTALQQLETLEQLALARLSDGFNVDPVAEAVRHALQLQCDADENRRALRRFLRAYWTGRTNYLLTHPRTQAWLRRHPRLNVALWQRGIPYAAETAEAGPLIISIEQDPLEALKLGTYVGSCLGLGGSFAYSAAAAVLDINKQVLYARRPNGTVLARQLIALSEGEQLVCFSVYPYTTSTELQRHFSAYDRQFAGALELPLWRPDSEEEEYAIPTILARGWWDDSAWGGKTPPLTDTTRSSREVKPSVP